MELKLLLQSVGRAGYFQSPPDVQERFNAQINGDLDQWRKGLFDPGQPALIIDPTSGKGIRVSRVLAVRDERLFAYLVIHEDELIKNIGENKKAKEWPKEGDFYLGEALEIAGGISDDDKLSLLSKIHHNDYYGWTMAPGQVIQAFGKELIEKFYAGLPQYSPIFFCDDGALADYTPDFGVFLVKISGKKSPVEIAVIEYGRPYQGISYAVTTKKDIYSTDIWVERFKFQHDNTSLLGGQCQAEITGTLIRTLSDEEHTQLTKDLEGFIQEQGLLK